MYGHQFHPANRLFGLSCGQMRSQDFVHNGGWYNRLGEKLGWGDLSPEDVQRISHEVADEELFIILYESDSFWNFVTRPGIIGSMSAVKPDVEAPGVDYVVEKCCFIIARDRLFYVDPFDGLKEKSITRSGLSFEVLTREAAKQLIAP